MAVQGVSNNQHFLNIGIKHTKMEQSITGKQFDKLMSEPKKNVEENQEKINQMIDDISKIKEMLDTDLTNENLGMFKNAVKDFLNYYTKNQLQMEDHTLRDSRGYRKKVSTVKAIDDQVNKLTEKMLTTNYGHLDALKRIGEIQGLVLEFYV